MVARSRPPSFAHVTLRDVRAQPLAQLRPAPPTRDVAHGVSDGLLLSKQNDEPLAPFCSTARYDRAAHTYGKSFPDYVRGLVGEYSTAPDVVAYPRTEEEIAAVLDWAGGAQASVTPFGGGSSVVGGVEPRCHAGASLAVYSRLTRPRAPLASRPAFSTYLKIV
jgi:hypothetical protein